MELVAGQADEAFARLIEQIKRRAGDERDQVRLRLLDLFETLGNADPRVQKARRNLMAALFIRRLHPRSWRFTRVATWVKRQFFTLT